MDISDTKDNLEWAYRSLWKWNQNIILKQRKNITLCECHVSSYWKKWYQRLADELWRFIYVARKYHDIIAWGWVVWTEGFLAWSGAHSSPLHHTNPRLVPNRGKTWYIMTNPCLFIPSPKSKPTLQNPKSKTPKTNLTGMNRLAPHHDSDVFHILGC